MNSDPTESILNDAATDLRSQVEGLHTPPFSPKRPIGSLVAVAALVLIVIGGGVFLTRNNSNRTVIETPVDESEGGRDQDPAVSTTVAPTTVPATTDQVERPLAQSELVFGHDATPPAASWAKPALYETYQDPVYGTDIRRLTSAEGTRFNRNTYSRRQAENADGTLFLTYHGDAEYRVYGRASGELIRILPVHPDAEPQWHASDPDRIRYLAGPNSSTGDLQLYEVSVSSGEMSVVADLTARLQSQLPGALYMKDRAEGSPSANGDRYAWLVYNDREIPIGIVSYEVSTDSLLGVLPLTDQWEENNDTQLGRLDWVGTSPSGEYVIAGYWNVTLVFNFDLTNERVVNQKADHSDIAIGADGEDVYVYIDFGATSPDAGFLVAVDLDTLERARLFEVYSGANTSIHISGKGYNKPGWVVVSTYNCKNPGAWSCDKVMAVELVPNARIVNLAHTYNCGVDYWTETQAVVNREFTRVYFNSDGGSCGIDAEVYEVTVPYFD